MYIPSGRCFIRKLDYHALAVFQEANLKLTRARLTSFLLVMFVVSTAVAVFAQYRDDHDRDDHRSGACFFTEANFGGEKFCMREGERMAQVPEGFNDRISSIRIFGRTEITVYQNRGFSGPPLRL